MAEAPRADRDAAPLGERSGVLSGEILERGETPAGEPERWVRRQDAGFATDPALAASGVAAHWSLHVDLAAERSLSQIVALSVALPPILGWCWAANAFDRYRRLFA
jgi:hypothetical protein